MRRQLAAREMASQRRAMVTVMGRGIGIGYAMEAGDSVPGFAILQGYLSSLAFSIWRWPTFGSVPLKRREILARWRKMMRPVKSQAMVIMGVRSAGARVVCRKGRSFWLRMVTVAAKAVAAMMEATEM